MFLRHYVKVNVLIIFYMVLRHEYICFRTFNIIFWIYAQCIYLSSDYYLMIIPSFTHYLT
jgi:hypothetical protein